MTEPGRLEVVPGTGHLVRRAEGMLFVPSVDAAGSGAEPPSSGGPSSGGGASGGVAALLDAFAGAEGDALLDATSSQVIASDLACPAFAVVSWSDRIQVQVFGDLEVHTDHPAVPMLSGAGSRTWVEHGLRGVTDRVRIMVAGPDADPATDLRDGVVPAGGFALDLVVDAPSAPPEDLPADPVRDPEPAAIVDDRPTDSAPDAGEGAAAAPLDLPEVGEGDPLSAIQAAVVRDGAAAAAPSADTSGAPSEVAVRTDVLPDMSSAGWSDAGGSDAGESGGESGGGSDDGGSGADGARPQAGATLVEAVECPSGHLSPPSASTCRVCGADVGGAEVRTVPRPTLGALQLDDGSALPLDRNYRIGRRPRRDDDATAAPIEGEKISRTHVEVVLRGWDVLVRDCNSTNGTWVAAGPDEDLRRVDPDVAILVEPGARIRIDQRVLVYDPAPPVRT